jgi:signal transduction histidine kinase
MGSSYVGVGLHRSGREFPIDIALTPLPTESGLYVASAIRDVSTQRQLETELRQNARDLEMADLHKDRFLSTLAHELSSPLAAIAYSAENLRRNKLPDNSRGQAIDIVLEEVRLIQRLLEDLNELPRIQRGDLPLRKVLTDLTKATRLAIDISNPLIQQHRHRLQFDSPPEPLYIEGDSTRLTQIITNLLNNAARYTPDGGRIRISLGREGNDIVLKVTDNGIGIPKDMLTRVFDLFTRLDAARTTYTKGMGIGLAYVRRLVEFHGGTVRAFSDGDGLGAEFVVRLPQATDAALRD